MIPILILAAGKSSRMGGRDKLLEHIDGVPILKCLAERALKSGPVYVTLPSADHPRRFVLPQAAQVVAVSGQMSASIKAGIAALPAEVTGVIIFPADMPDITEEDIGKIQDAARTSDALIVRASTKDGHAGHPTYFAASLFERFAELDGDRGASRLTVQFKNQTRLVPLEEDRARLDLDTPEDWAAYRAR